MGISTSRGVEGTGELGSETDNMYDSAIAVEAIQRKGPLSDSGGDGGRDKEDRGKAWDVSDAKKGKGEEGATETSELGGMKAVSTAGRIKEDADRGEVDGGGEGAGAIVVNIVSGSGVEKTEGGSGRELLDRGVVEVGTTLFVGGRGNEEVERDAL